MFATLDSVTRKNLSPGSRAILFTDTVGFISEIPNGYLERVDFQSALTRRIVGGKLKNQAKLKVRRTVTTFDDFKVGDNVQHSIFGVGEIMVLSGSGENQRVGVVFKDGTKKKLIVKYANLTKVN